MEKDRPINVAVSIIAGLVLLAAGIILNEWVLTALFSADHVIAASHRIIIWAVNIFLVSMGWWIIKSRRRFTMQGAFVIAGALFFGGGLLFNESVVSILLDLDLSNTDKIIIRFFDLYLIITGTLLILSRKYIKLDGIILYGFTSFFCFSVFLGYDFYRASSYIKNIIALNRNEETQIKIHALDRQLGWIPKANTIGRHKDRNFDVIYETDNDGFRKLDNIKNPRFSIYFFGDSFTFGHGVDNQETFSAIIKKKYLIKDANVYNAGVMGYGIVQMFQRFLNMKDRIRKGDLVIFTPLCEDIKRNVQDFEFPYFIFYTNIMRVEHYPYFENTEIKQHRLEKGFFRKLKLLALIAPWTKNFWRTLNQLFITDTTSESIEMMKIARQETMKRDAHFALFFLPRIEQCLQGKYCADLSGFNYFDIMNFFPTQQEELYKLVFNNDHHYNVNGHEVAARAIVKTLINVNILDQFHVRVN